MKVILIVLIIEALCLITFSIIVLRSKKEKNVSFTIEECEKEIELLNKDYLSSTDPDIKNAIIEKIHKNERFIDFLKIK